MLRVLFQDEGRFGRINDTRRCWAPLPVRPQVGHQIVREYVYSLIAVSPRDGRMASLIMPWVDSEVMSIFLAHTAREFDGDYCILFLDGAGWHRANNLRVPPSIKLIFLPPYSPELNPVEILWEHIRENYFKNLAFDSLDEVEDVLVEALNSLDAKASMVKSMVNYNWLNTLCLTSN